MTKKLYEMLERFEGQPIKVFTDDGRIHTGIELDCDEESVRIIDKCGRLMLIELRHVDAVEEPQMELRHCKKGNDFEEFEEPDGKRKDWK